MVLKKVIHYMLESSEIRRLGYHLNKTRILKSLNTLRIRREQEVVGMNEGVYYQELRRSGYFCLK